MKRFLCETLPSPGQPALLTATESHHLKKVLRLKPGDTVEAMDGNGHLAIGSIRYGSNQVFLDFVSKPLKSEELIRSFSLPLTLEMAILKGEAMEWVIEKAVELGVQRLIPIETAHCVVDTKKKGVEFFQNRWQKIADQALKQCGRLGKMTIECPIEFSSLNLAHPVTPRLWCDEKSKAMQESLPSESLSHALKRLSGSPSFSTLIGPEGGWSDHEREMLIRAALQENSQLIRTDLGPLTFRAETAALYSMSVLHAHFYSLQQVP